MTPRAPAAFAVALAVLTLLPRMPSAAGQGSPGLTAPDRIVRAYDAIFDARFEQLPGLLPQTCGPAPREVCLLLETIALWWQIQLDPANTSRDAAFRSMADSAIAASEEWTRREPRRAESWFYLGGAYGARVQLHVLRGQQLAAARDGKRIKEALERALELDAGLQDAYFGIGLYHYYADVAPAAAKMLRFLLFLPGGDRVKGLEEMLRARSGGQILRSEAEYQLQVVYLWYEHSPQKALELLTDLRDRHPHNPHFPQLIAEVRDTYQHDLTASLRAWQSLLDLARANRVGMAGMAEARARLGIASVLDRLFETDLALDHLRAVVAGRPSSPFGAVAQAQLQLGQCFDRLGYRAEAVAAYRAAAAAAPADDPLRIADRARSGIRNAPNASISRAYRLSIEGARALERGALNDASRLLDESLMLQAADPVTEYRKARLLLTQKNDAAALTMLEAALRSRPAIAPTVYASAALDAARLYEQRGERARAIELYGIARGVFGADQRTKDAAQRALSRLTPSSAPSPR